MENITPTAVACPICQAPSRKFGTNRNGTQHYQCLTCKKTHSGKPAGPLGRMLLPLDKAILCVQLIVEGNSLRSTTRIARVNLRTVIDLLVMIGNRCESMLEARIRGVSVSDLELDEVWGFVAEKEKTRLQLHPERVDTGDCYCFSAVERNTKLVLAWHLGTRTPEDTAYFADKLAVATSGQFQVSTDGFTPYAHAVPAAMPTADFAQIIKQFSTKDDKKEGRYSLGVVIGTVKVPRHGSPDLKRVSTSHVERHNLTIRMQNRRMTRLTNAFSKKWENHQAAFGLQFAYYNFCRPHQTLTDATAGEGKKKRQTTPAMAAGIADHPWTLEELIRNSMPVNIPAAA
jgi:transposase-like protein/IS1 family transposase